MKRAARQAREAATHEESKPENDKDTRALEASYLAGAQAARARELEGAIKAVKGMPLLDFGEGKTIQSSAIVTLEDEDGARTTLFLAPFGGGIRLTVGLAAGAGRDAAVTARADAARRASRRRARGPRHESAS